MARLIDADALKESIDEHVYLVHHGFNETEYGCTQYGIHQIIDETPTIDAEPHWIPCSERLPIDDDYRESMECLDGCVWYFTDKGSMGLGYYYYSTKEWSTLRDLKPDGKVIAWMPLPDPYEVEK